MNLYEPLMNLENEKQLETKEIMNLMNLLLMLKGLLRGVNKGRGNRFIRLIRFIFENCLPAPQRHNVRTISIHAHCEK